jgi:hypothetical protein
MTAAAAAAAVAIAGLVVLPTPAIAAEPIAEDGKTVVTLKIKDCEGCTVQPFSVQQRAMGEQPYTDWKGRALKVRNGRVQFTIPTAYTAGMSLRLDAPWESGSAGYVPMVSLSKSGYCWAGTNADSATLRITVKRLTTDGFPDGKAVIPNAYLSSLKEPKSPDGHQDLPYCRVRS